jgi:hypothetical protein
VNRHSRTGEEFVLRVPTSRDNYVRLIAHTETVSWLKKQIEAEFDDSTCNSGFGTWSRLVPRIQSAGRRSMCMMILIKEGSMERSRELERREIGRETIKTQTLGQT